MLRNRQMFNWQLKATNVTHIEQRKWNKKY